MGTVPDRIQADSLIRIEMSIEPHQCSIQILNILLRLLPHFLSVDPLYG